MGAAGGERIPPFGRNDKGLGGMCGVGGCGASGVFCGAGLRWIDGGGRPHAVRGWEKGLGGEEGFAEVAGDDFIGVADGCEVGAGVPAEEYIDVGRYTFELGRGERFQQVGLEQGRDAGRVHEEEIVREALAALSGGQRGGWALPAESRFLPLVGMTRGEERAWSRWLE